MEHHHEFDDLVYKAGKSVLEGVGKDAEVITNAKGGKQSKSPMAMHLIDPQFLEEWASDKTEMFEYKDRDDCICVDGDDCKPHSYYKAIENIATYMYSGAETYLLYAMDELEYNAMEQIVKIAKVLQYGADRYAPNNWRLIPREEHINHALIHIIAELMGDKQDQHIDHALCRLMMAFATEESEGFSYTEYKGE